MGVLNNVTKDSHFTLLKVYNIVVSISGMVEGTPSPYIKPSSELSLAQSYLHTDLHLALKHIKNAEKLYAKESALARRYAKYSESIEYSDNNEHSILGKEYVSMIRSGKYSQAEKILHEIEEKGIPKIDTHFNVSLSLDKSEIVIQNVSGSTLFVNSLAIASKDQCICGDRFKGNICPGESQMIELDSKVNDYVDVEVSYFLNGKYLTRKFKV